MLPSEGCVFSQDAAVRHLLQLKDYAVQGVTSTRCGETNSTELPKQEDRHKLKRVYMSGAYKRKLAKEKNKNNTEIISKTRRMTEFFITQPNTTSSSEQNSLQTMISDETFNTIFDETKVACTKMYVSIPEVKRRKVSTKVDYEHHPQHFFENTK
ncbi:hypothetical protein QTP88_006572 [Uroleucon formosanum]